VPTPANPGSSLRAHACYVCTGLRRLTRLIVDPSTESRLQGIQGLRALAAGSILLFHIALFSEPSGAEFDVGPISWYIVPHLPLGVTLLFLLSAFLLYRPFAKAVMRPRPLPSLTSYLRNRALRILPAYWVILLFTGLVLQTTHVRESDASLGIGALADPVLVLLNATFLQSFHPSTILTGIGPAWALADVVVFYAVLPLLVLLAYALAKRASTRQGRRLAALAPAALLFVIGLSGKVVATFVVPGRAWDASWHAVIERSFWAHADFFALGLAVAVFRVDSEDGVLRLPRWWWKVATAALLLIALPTAKWTTPEGFADGSLSNSAYDTLMAVVCALFLALVVLPAHEKPTALVRLLEGRFIVAVGVVSYSLFLWQVPLIFWLREQGFTFPGPAGLAGNVVVAGLLTFALSALTYRYFEFPALRRKAKTRPGPAGDAAVATQQAPAAP
jgi:peptidoglycan/LPS O-acetylase OafA/YrhL